MTVLERTEALSINRMTGDSSEPFLLKYNLNPVRFPCLESTGGSCQDAKILVEVIAVTENLPGAFEGARIKKNLFLSTREINPLMQCNCCLTQSGDQSVLQLAFSNQLISLPLNRSFVKFSQSIDLSVTTISHWSNPTRPGLLIFLGLHRDIFTILRAVFRYVITSLK